MAKKPTRPRSLPVSQASAQQLWSEAVEHYSAGRMAAAERLAMSLVNSPNLHNQPLHNQALHLAALAAYRQQRADRAIERLALCVSRDPGYATGWKDLGSIHFDLGNWTEAERPLRRYLELVDSDVGAWGMLATTVQRLNRAPEACEIFERSLVLAPLDWRLHEGLAEALQALEQWDEAARRLRLAIEHQPDPSDLRRQLVALWRRAGQLDKAAEAARQWLEHEPDNPTAQHMSAALSNRAVPTRASDQYIKQVFDQFSETFDQALNDLQYRAPQLLGQLIERHLPSEKGNLSVLDAGCGTGLCGSILRPYAKRLLGVDLSGGMLAQAQKLGLYDQLVQMELTEFLNTAYQEYDLVVICDTLNYFGDLRPVLAAAHQALASGGKLAFTLELEEESTVDYRLCTTGRYRHQEPAVRQLLDEGQWRLICCQRDTLRIEAEQPVPALLLLCEPQSTAKTN